MNITQHSLPFLILIPLIGFFFSLMSKEGEKTSVHNIIWVGLFTILSNFLQLWYIFKHIDYESKQLQFLSSYKWIDIPVINIVFGIDIFSLMIIFAIHVMFFISFPSIRRAEHPKMIGSLSLLMLSAFTGFLLSADVFSFYMFFTGMLIPLFLLIGKVGEIKKQNLIFRFFIYNFLGSIVLFLVICALYHYHGGEQGILLKNVARIRMNKPYEYWVWGGIFIALLSRIPIWPFHYWISSVNGTIQNPLVFLAINLIPLTGIYGLIRFCPKTVPESVSYILSSLEIIAVISMLFIAMIGLINKDNRYKLFSFITVYYIVYLLGALLPTGKILLNIGYSLFAFLIIISVLEILSSYILQEQQQNRLNISGILCHAPRLSFLYSFFTLAAVGFPLSALFMNNFVILSYLFHYNFNLSVVIMIAIIISSASMLKELYLLKDNQYLHPNSVCIKDISAETFYGFTVLIILLLISFFNPLLLLGA